MPKAYARCMEGECSSIEYESVPGTKPNDDDNRMAKCKSSDNKPCLPERNCRCYVIVKHFTKNEKGDWEEDQDEKYFPSYSVGINKDRALSKNQVRDLEKSKPQPNPTEYGQVLCACLKLDDVTHLPMLAMNIQLRVPEDGYGNALKQLRETYGTGNVILAPAFLGRGPLKSKTAGKSAKTGRSLKKPAKGKSVGPKRRRG